MPGGSDGALGDLLSGFSTPARPESSAAKPEMDKDILDLFGPTPAPASASTTRLSASHTGHSPLAQQVRKNAIAPCAEGGVPEAQRDHSC